MSLLEALVAMIVLVCLGAAIAATLTSQQRSARDLADLHASRGDLRDAAAILAGELRGASVRDTLRFTADTAIELFTQVLVGVVCADAGGGRLLLAPIRHRGGGAQSAMLIPPDSGDLAWVWAQDATGEHGYWRRHRIAAYSEAASGSCAADPVPGGGRPPTLSLTEEISGMRPMLVHVVRRGRYSIYRSSDGHWYLGYRRCNALGESVCSGIQPVAGPYRASTADGAGIRFRFLDDNGDELLASMAPIATTRIELAIFSDTMRLNAGRSRRAALDDSVVVSIAARNRF